MRYRLSPAAEADLDDIWEHSAGLWGEAQAERYVSELRQRLEGLAAKTIPARSAAYIREGYFKCASASHMIYFRREEDGPIQVIRILHQSMDVLTQFGQA